MRRFTRFLVLVVTPAICLAATGPARAQRGNPSPSYIDPTLLARWTAANYQWWNSLTPRQQQLERAIGAAEEQHMARTGQYYIPVTDRTVLAMIRRIGASSHEAGWVRQRMEAYAELGRNLQSVGRTLEWMQSDPYWWLPPGMEPHP
jgi:hypothetical protein